MLQTQVVMTIKDILAMTITTQIACFISVIVVPTKMLSEIIITYMIKDLFASHDYDLNDQAKNNGLILVKLFLNYKTIVL